MSLSQKKCAPCSGSTPVLTPDEIAKLKPSISDWQVVNDKRLTKTFKFQDFTAPMKLADRIAVIANEEDHHPDLHVRYGELKIELWTHKIDGLSENDFIMAAKIDEAAKK